MAGYSSVKISFIIINIVALFVFQYSITLYLNKIKYE